LEATLDIKEGEFFILVDANCVNVDGYVNADIAKSNNTNTAVDR
jgi:hypothetical protein